MRFFIERFTWTLLFVSFNNAEVFETLNRIHGKIGWSEFVFFNSFLSKIRGDRKIGEKILPTSKARYKPYCLTNQVSAR